MGIPSFSAIGAKGGGSPPSICPQARCSSQGGTDQLQTRNEVIGMDGKILGKLMGSGMGAMGQRLPASLGHDGRPPHCRNIYLGHTSPVTDFHRGFDQVGGLKSASPTLQRSLECDTGIEEAALGALLSSPYGDSN